MMAGNEKRKKGGMLEKESDDELVGQKDIQRIAIGPTL
jgi:hypothetical protein